MVVAARASSSCAMLQQHTPVLAAAVARLCPAQARVILDGTVGAGGHTLRLLNQFPNLEQVWGIDRDPAAIRLARSIINEEAGFMAQRVELVHADFMDIGRVWRDKVKSPVDYVLLDIGVSSMQLNDANRGFSFDQDGPLDMRMDQENDSMRTALQLLEESSEEKITEILRQCGEERHARRIAQKIRFQIDRGALNTTKDLEEICWVSYPREHRPRTAEGKSKKNTSGSFARGRSQRKHPATRTFQALRIVVNRELDQLKHGLEACRSLLMPGEGRLAVISFHSLEDRIVKHAFREWREAGLVKVLTKKPIVADDDEVLSNPRSRSAKLRVCEAA